MPKILIIRFSAFGDIILTSPILRAIKHQLPDAKIHFCTKKNFSILMDSNPYIDKVHFLKDSLQEYILELKKEKFDYVLDLHNSLRSKIICYKLGLPYKSLKKHYLEKWLLENLKINRLPNSHIVDRYFDVASLCQIKNDGKGLDYFIPEKDFVNIGLVSPSLNQGFIAFAIGGQHATKRLPVDKSVELCARISSPIVLIGGKEDFDTGEAILKKLENKLIFNACGKYNLNQSASIVKQATKVISHDTAMMHVASAFQKEVFSIWGNTVPAYGMYPYKTKFHIIENKNLSCRPCTKIGYKKCPKGHFKCMLDLDFTNFSI